ncbi:MAG: Fic family protein [Microthrixaceae bacterium]
MTDDGVVFLDLDDLLAAASAAVGHIPAVRDVGLLESALARPQATVFGEDAYSSLHAKAAALLESVVGNRALVDGNKRLGLVAVRLLDAFNGHELSATDDGKYRLVVDIATGSLGGVEAISNRLADLVFRPEPGSTADGACR